MNIDPLAASRATGSQGAGDKKVDDAAMGQNAFMQLLLTQLQNQDPTSPQADGEFLAQLAQFSQLEQLQQMNKKLDAMASVFSMVGSTTTTESSTTSGSSSRASTETAEGSR
ncbi:MAG: flagellar hook capping FlgD N-terminal domain-containing protein [Vicinamibacterales bacterium]